MKFGSKQLRLFSSLEKVLEKQLLTKKNKVFFFSSAFFYTNVDFSRNFFERKRPIYFQWFYYPDFSLFCSLLQTRVYSSNIKQNYFRVAFYYFLEEMLFKN